MSLDLIGSLRSASFTGLVAASVWRVSLFHYHAIYPVPFFPLLSRDLLLVVPFLGLGLAACFVARNSFNAIFFLALAAAVIGWGLFIDYDHFSHLSKESMFDGVYYLSHIFVSLVGAVLWLVFQPRKSNDEQS